MWTAIVHTHVYTWCIVCEAKTQHCCTYTHTRLYIVQQKIFAGKKFRESLKIGIFAEKLSRMKLCPQYISIGLYTNTKCSRGIFSRMAVYPRNSRKFSPVKISRYTVPRCIYSCTHFSSAAIAESSCSLSAWQVPKYCQATAEPGSACT